MTDETRETLAKLAEKFESDHPYGTALRDVLTPRTYDSNKRVYAPLTDAERAAGRVWSSGGPIYRESWRQWRVVGETRVSWLVESHGTTRRVRKDMALTSEQALDDACYLHDHRHRIAERD